jgi:glutathione S-transferase
MSIKLVSFKLCPFVQRAVILLEEKAVAYTLEYKELDDPPEWFRQRSLFGKVPLMHVDDEVLFESAVILDYLDEVYPPRLHPHPPLRRAQHTNQAIDINTLSRRVFAHGKASKRRCSTPTASFDNAVGEPTHDGLSLTYH